MMNLPVVLKIDMYDPEIDRIREAAQVCREDKLIVFPTETVYGLGGRMSMSGIAEKLREIKGRVDSKPFAYHIADWEMLETLQVEQTPAFRFMARQFWPGPVTLVAKNWAGEKIGIRYVKNRIAAALIQEVGEPFIATSANKSGQASPYNAQQARQMIEGCFDCLIDGGRTELAVDSTVVDIGEAIPVMLRAGAQKPEVEKAIERIKSEKIPLKKILVVCTGNSCRSPMAAGWLKHELQIRRLSDRIDVSSCGVSAREGFLVSSEAELVMSNRQIDIRGHRTHLCRKSDVWGADLILAMSAQHAVDLERLMPLAEKKIIVLDVEDPIGLGMDVYEKVFQDIQKKIKKNINEITKIS